MDIKRNQELGIFTFEPMNDKERRVLSLIRSRLKPGNKITYLGASTQKGAQWSGKKVGLDFEIKSKKIKFSLYWSDQKDRYHVDDIKRACCDKPRGLFFLNKTDKKGIIVTISYCKFCKKPIIGEKEYTIKTCKKCLLLGRA